MGDIIYSRYIQNANGTFDRHQIPEAACPPPPKNTDTVPVEQDSKPWQPERHCPAKPAKDFGKLFQKLLNRNLDAGDLLIILILLLILQQQQEDHLAILLTLAFFLLL